MNKNQDKIYTIDDISTLCRKYNRKVEIGYVPQHDGTNFWYVAIATEKGQFQPFD